VAGERWVFDYVGRWDVITGFRTRLEGVCRIAFRRG